MRHGADAGAHREDRGHGGHLTPVSLLLRAAGIGGEPLMLMRRRPADAREGRDRWELPGGFRRGDETPADTARRAAERSGVDPGSMRVRGVRDGDGSGHRTVIADIAGPPAMRHQDDESPRDEETAPTWIAEPDIAALDLDPALASAWPGLRAPGTGLLVDAANVVGSRADGWWRDRAGAAARLLRDITEAGPGLFPIGDGRFAWIARTVVVLEGAAKAAPDIAGAEVVRAPGSGDDTIVDVAHRGGDWIVVTADRGLRARLPATARAVGPATFRSWICTASR